MGVEGVETTCEGLYCLSPPSSSELELSLSSDRSLPETSRISTSSGGASRVISMSWMDDSEEELDVRADLDDFAMGKTGDGACRGIGGTAGGTCGVLPRVGDNEASLSPLARASMGFPPFRPWDGGGPIAPTEANGKREVDK
jgi:hypothetical protein